MPKERYISPEEIQEIIDELRLKQYNNGILINKINLINKIITNAVAKSYNSKITKVSKNSQQNNSETVATKHDEKIPKQRYVFAKEKQKIINNFCC